MSQTHLDKAREVAELFAASFFKIDNPKVVCRGNTKLGYYFTVKPPGDETVTLAIDRTCQLIEMYLGQTTLNDIEKGHRKYGDYVVNKDSGGFVQAPVMN